MIEVQITPTMKSYHPSAEWQRWQSRKVRFFDMAEVKDFLQREYGTAKRMPMYSDSDGKTRKVGYVIGFRAGDRYEGHWLQQDWVSFYEVTQLDLA